MKLLIEVRALHFEWGQVKGRILSIELLLNNNPDLVLMTNILRKMDLSIPSLVERKLITMTTSLDQELMTLLQT
jgi:hypothetical protein